MVWLGNTMRPLLVAPYPSNFPTIPRFSQPFPSIVDFPVATIVQLYKALVRISDSMIRSHMFGVRFRKEFDRAMLSRQAGMDRYVYNRLLEAFREEYRRTGMVNTSRARINAWYTDLRNRTGPEWLRLSVSDMTRQILHDLGRHYGQYVETERLKAAGITPKTEWGEPRFKKYSDPISIPLKITHDNTHGDARFTGERSIRVAKMGEIGLSRPFPVPNYRPKTAQLLQTADGKWRIAIACEEPDPEPYVGEPALIGVDRNVGNVSTPDHILVPPYKTVRRMRNAERTAERAQRIASRRQKPDHKNGKPGSRRWARAQRRVARKKRRAADIRHTVSHKASRAIADAVTHAAAEKLNTKNMTKSAKGTKDNPGKNVRQKSGLNRSILEQCWGLFVALLAYKLAGGVIYVPAAYTSQRCSMCGFLDAVNRDGREFLCLLCRYHIHADRNAAKNIENDGARKLGRPCRRGNILSPLNEYPAIQAGSAHVKGRLDVEGSGMVSPQKRHAQTREVRPSGMVVLWDDV